jgi:hypothetical protein
VPYAVLSCGCSDRCGSCAGAKFLQRCCPESAALPCRLLPQRLVVCDRLSAVNACLEGSKHADKMEVLMDVLQKLSNRLPDCPSCI